MTQMLSGDFATQAASTRERLRAAALELLAENGFDGIRVSAIARRAGLTTGAIYASYAGKNELLTDAIVSQQASLFQNAVEPRTGDRTLASVVLRALTQPAADEHRSLLDVMAAASRNPAMLAVLTAHMEVRNQTVRGLIESAQERGRIDPGIDADVLGHLIRLLGLGGVVSQALGLEGASPEALGRLLDRMAVAFEPSDPETFGDA